MSVLSALDAVVLSGGDFAKIVEKWRPKVYRSVVKVAAVLQISRDDALQEVLLNMWNAYMTYNKPQVHFDDGIWDVVEDGVRYTLRNPATNEVRIVSRWRAHPIDKRMSCASFVYLRMVQWQSNLFALHYTAKNGYQRAGTVKVNGVKRDSFERVVFEESLDKTSTDEENTRDDHYQLASNCMTPEQEVIFADLVRSARVKLTGNALLVLSLIVASGGSEDGVDFPMPPCPDRMHDVTYFAYVLGISQKDARVAFRKVLHALKELRSYEALNLSKCGEVVRSQPMLDAMGGPRALHRYA